jgi:hypothetical protein
MRTQAQIEAGAKLIEALRVIGRHTIRAVELPNGRRFQWHFITVHDGNECGAVGCAIGVAKEIGLIDEIAHGHPQCQIEMMSDLLGLDFDIAHGVFYGGDPAYGRVDNITAGAVARVLEMRLAA